jgi:ferredoxin/flavodoxin---NADP+ reductase
LRAEHYNATLVNVREVHEGLRVIRVRPDFPIPPFQPGQFTVLGLGEWEPRTDGVCDDHANHEGMVRRAYSISCPVLGEDRRLITCGECDFLEFYIALVNRPNDTPPALTPRLFGTSVGDRLFVGRKIGGGYTLARLRPSDNVLFIATGTGEAPHNAMIAQLLAEDHQGRIVAVTSVRYRRDLAYREQHRALEQLFSNYRYFNLITRDTSAAREDDREAHGIRLQEFLTSGQMEEFLGQPLVPGEWHVFLCGSPAMIGLPTHERTGDTLRFPVATGMTELLVRRGFTLSEHEEGNIHFEKYW